MTSQIVSQAESLIEVGKFDLKSVVLHLEKKRNRIIIKIQTLLNHFDLQVAIKINWTLIIAKQTMSLFEMKLKRSEKT